MVFETLNWRMLAYFNYQNPIVQNKSVYNTNKGIRRVSFPKFPSYKIRLFSNKH